MTVNDLSRMYRKVAKEAWMEMNQWHRDCYGEDDKGASEPAEVFLYVFANGSWTIDGVQYIQSTNGCISCVSVALYNGPTELAEDIEANEDWDAIEAELGELAE